MTVVLVLVVVLVAAIILLNTGILYHGTTALTVGGTRLSPAQVNYYFGNEYVNLVRMNDEAEQEIARSVDLNRVYEVAVGQYGMVFPRDNEVITINVRSEGYVRQYDDVAAAEKPEQTVFESLMEKLMR